MIARTDFDDLPLGPVAGNVLMLKSPPGTGAMLIGSMEIIETPATAKPAGWGTKVLKLNATVQIVLGGPIRGVGFSAGNRLPGWPNPSLLLGVFGPGFVKMPTVRSTPSLDGAALPVFAHEWMITLGGGYEGGVYGTGNLSSDIIGSIVLSDEN